MSAIIIDDSNISFNNPGTAGLVGMQKNFSLKIDDIKIVGLKFSLFIDNDEYYVVLVDKNGISYFLNSGFFDEESFNKLQEVFKIEFEIARYNYDFYEEGISVIQYPDTHFGKPIFETNGSIVSKLFVIFQKLFMMKTPGWGYLSRESKAVVKSSFQRS